MDLIGIVIGNVVIVALIAAIYQIHSKRMAKLEEENDNIKDNYIDKFLDLGNKMNKTEIKLTEKISRLEIGLKGQINELPNKILDLFNKINK